MRKYVAVFFDLDGTLRANQPEGFEAFIEYAARVGIALTPAQIVSCERAVHQYWADGAQVADHLSRYDERSFWVNYNQLLLKAMDIRDQDRVAEKIQDQFDDYEPQDVVFADADRARRRDVVCCERREKLADELIGARFGVGGLE